MSYKFKFLFVFFTFFSQLSSSTIYAMKVGDGDPSPAQTSTTKSKPSKLFEEKSRVKVLTSQKQHRRLLKNALNDTENSIIISSPLISKSVTRVFLKNCKKLENPIEITVYTNEVGSKVFAAVLNECGKELIDRVHLRTTEDCHAKVLIGDKKLIAVGSFDWLGPVYDQYSKQKAYVLSSVIKGRIAKELIKETKKALEERTEPFDDATVLFSVVTEESATEPTEENLGTLEQRVKSCDSLYILSSAYTKKGAQAVIKGTTQALEEVEPCDNIFDDKRMFSLGACMVGELEEMRNPGVTKATPREDDLSDKTREVKAEETIKTSEERVEPFDDTRLLSLGACMVGELEEMRNPGVTKATPREEKLSDKTEGAIVEEEEVKAETLVRIVRF